MSNPEYNVELVTKDDESFVKITVGSEVLEFSIDEAYAFSDVIVNVANQPAFEAHVDQALDGWGQPGWTDGGTC